MGLVPISMGSALGPRKFDWSWAHRTGPRTGHMGLENFIFFSYFLIYLGLNKNYIKGFL